VFIRRCHNLTELYFTGDNAGDECRAMRSSFELMIAINNKNIYDQLTLLSLRFTHYFTCDMREATVVLSRCVNLEKLELHGLRIINNQSHIITDQFYGHIRNNKTIKSLSITYISDTIDFCDKLLLHTNDTLEELNITYGITDINYCYEGVTYMSFLESCYPIILYTLRNALRKSTRLYKTNLINYYHKNDICKQEIVDMLDQNKNKVFIKKSLVYMCSYVISQFS
jgi:hypothetical protein